MEKTTIIYNSSIRLPKRKEMSLFAFAKRYGAEVIPTERQGHGQELARRAVDAGARIVGALGGDGTVSEVVNGSLGKEVVNFVLPGGTGNDFAKYSLGVRDFSAGLEKLVRYLETGASKKRIDVLSFASETLNRHFVSTGDLHFAAEATVEAKKFKEKFPRLAYPLGAISAYGRVEQKYLRQVRINDELEMEIVPAWMVNVSNSPRIGGGLRIAPYAKPDDGYMDVVFVKKPRFGQLLRLLLSVQLGCSYHVKSDIAEYFSGQRFHEKFNSLKSDIKPTSLEVEVYQAMRVELDGEVFEPKDFRYEFSVSPHKAQFIN